MSDNTKPAADNGMTSFPIYAVTVERSNNEKVVAEVPEYEIPVLKALHGEFNVTKGEHIFDDDRPSEAAAILEALKRKYNNKNTGDVVSVVYRNADELAKASGISVGKATRPAESLQIDGRKKSAAK
jgi:hypothetical protein